MNQYVEKYFQVLNQQISAGILIYRFNKQNELEVLLGKNGGPFYTKVKRSWNIPKGHIEGAESIKDGAIREFEEQTSIKLTIQDINNLIYLGMNCTKSGKKVHIFALKKDCNPNSNKVQIKSNLCKVQWPAKSKHFISIPELSQACYFNINTANDLIFNYQKVFLTNLQRYIGMKKNEQ